MSDVIFKTGYALIILDTFSQENNLDINVWITMQCMVLKENYLMFL